MANIRDALLKLWEWLEEKINLNSLKIFVCLFGDTRDLYLIAVQKNSLAPRDSKANESS